MKRPLDKTAVRRKQGVIPIGKRRRGGARRLFDLHAESFKVCELPGMNRLRQQSRIWVVLLICGTACFGARAQDTNHLNGLDYPAFKIITERNIFDANRSGRRASTPRESRPPVRVDSFALVGTMTYSSGSMAFFDGSDSDYQKTVTPGGTIAGYQVTDIALDGVKLETEDQQLEMKVGTQMRREDQGEWKPAEGTGLYASSGRERSGDSRREYSSRSDTVSTSSAGETGSGAGGDMSEVLKRLMERREQENK